jgi:hypothetical protein
MIRTLLMALGAYTLYRMYVPLEPPSARRELLSDMRSGGQKTRQAAGQASSGAES